MSEEYEVRWSTEAIYDVADIEDYHLFQIIAFEKCQVR